MVENIRKAVAEGLKTADQVMGGDSCGCEQCDEIREWHVTDAVVEYLIGKGVSQLVSTKQLVGHSKRRAQPDDKA